MIDFERELNTEQLAAATAPDGASLVLAAAGTGKTRTLVYRVAWLVEREVPTDRILLLTFTNKAAREMLDRARTQVGAQVGGIWGGTFHHMANRILRRHARSVGFPNDYTILDRDDSLSLIKGCLKALGLTQREFPKPGLLMGLFSRAANTKRPLAELAQSHFAETSVDLGDVLAVQESYARRKDALGAMDFDDLLVNGLRLFDEQPRVLQQYQDRFLHVLVDEYQDTNAIQSQWVDGVCGRHGNILVVGDDFQSIYSWRGADYRNIMSFPERYPQARVFKLETNYRSVPEILEVANACIAHNPEQFQKTMRATREPYRKPVVVRLRDGAQQARYLLEEVRRLQREGYRMNEMAVLYRAHFHAMELQSHLARERVPYLITSGVRFFEQAHVKDVCSLLRILHAPHDELGFRRLLELFPGVGQATSSKVWRKLGAGFDVRQSGHVKLVADALRPAAREIWERLEPTFSYALTPAETNEGASLIEAFVRDFYRQYAIDTFENYPARLEDISELAAFAGRFATLQGFLSEVALLTNLDAEVENLAHDSDEALRLSTIHQAKGLEWKVVFVLWLAEGMFPSGRAMEESPAAASEERRLFYVAVTRAQDALYLCVPEVRRLRERGSMPCLTSRFIDELPRELVEREQGLFV